MSNNAPQPQVRKTNWASIISAAAGATAVFSYLWGSIFLRSYYESFGIPIGAIRLSPSDYISNALTPLVLVAGIATLVELLHHNITNNFFFGFSLTTIAEIKKGTEKSLGLPALLRELYRKNPADTAMNIVMIFSSIILAAGALYLISVSYVRGLLLQSFVGAAALIAGIGIPFFFLQQVPKLLFSHDYKAFGTGQVVSTVLVLVTPLILGVSILAQLQANYDFQRFPEAVISYRGQLPSQLVGTEGPNSGTISKTLRVITVQEDRLYAYLKDDLNGQSRKNVAVYSIDWSFIEVVQYYPPAIRSSRNSP